MPTLRAGSSYPVPVPGQDLQVSEFVLSNELVSMALAMVAESPEVNTILAELFTEEGNELYVHPADRYLRRAPRLGTFCPPRSMASSCPFVIGRAPVLLC